MCGRFVSRTDAETERAFGLTRSAWRKGWASYNVAPSQAVPIVRAADGEREGVLVRWGLIPFWARGEVPKYSTINARSESIATAASYRGPWRRGQRCVIPALGFYEWKQLERGKQPWFIRLAGGEPFGLLGLWDRSVKADGEAVDSCTIITVPANPLVAGIHTKDRMPAMATPDICMIWLESSTEAAKGLLKPFPAELMDAWPVSTRVNSPANDGPELADPAGRDS
jgi:putative SOS response-associated peptidase YedK